MRGLGAALTCVVMATLGCREAQEGGPRRVTPDDAGTVSDAEAASSCGELACNEPAHCEESDGKAHCVCPPGYTGDASACEDVDECADAETNDCGENARCQNSAGSFECICAQGFAGDGKTCTSLSNCGEDSNTCHPDAICMTADAGVSCTCGSGFQGDGELCSDIDECSDGSGHCSEHAHCQNRRGSFDCACDALYEGDGKAQCRDACQVALDDPMRCDRRGGARCSFSSAAVASCTSCLPGYLGDGKTCAANGECAALGCGDNTVCAGAAGARSCECADGFRGTPADGCDDIDECDESSICDETNSRCLNAPGGYVCDCAEGFERVDGECRNIDECARDRDLCDPAADCVDRSPGYDCKCKDGYQGDGFACRDIDECQTLGDAACANDGKVTCQNKPGGYACVCPQGYAGDPKQGCYCDLSGYWGLRQDASITVPMDAAGDVVLIARSTTRLTLWQLRKFRFDGDKITVETQLCGGDRGPEIYSPLYEEEYSSAIPNMNYDKTGLEPGAPISMTPSSAQPGNPFNAPKFAALYGLKLNDPLNDPWPENFEDVAAGDWLDTDGDGEPGITWWPEGTTQPTGGKDGETYDYVPVKLQGSSSLIEQRTGCVSVALRNIGSLEGKIESCNRITGRVITEKIEARVYSCTLLRKEDWDTTDVTCSAKDWSNARRCSEENVRFLDDEDQTTESQGQFELVKLDDVDATGIDCATVRNRLPALPRQ